MATLGVVHRRASAPSRRNSFDARGHVCNFQRRGTAKKKMTSVGRAGGRSVGFDRSDLSWSREVFVESTSTRVGRHSSGPKYFRVQGRAVDKVPGVGVAAHMHLEKFRRPTSERRPMPRCATRRAAPTHRPQSLIPPRMRGRLPEFAVVFVGACARGRPRCFCAADPRPAPVRKVGDSEWGRRRRKLLGAIRWSGRAAAVAGLLRRLGPSVWAAGRRPLSGQRVGPPVGLLRWSRVQKRTTPRGPASESSPTASESSPSGASVRKRFRSFSAIRGAGSTTTFRSAAFCPRALASTFQVAVSERSSPPGRSSPTSGAVACAKSDDAEAPAVCVNAPAHLARHAAQGQPRHFDRSAFGQRPCVNFSGRGQRAKRPSEAKQPPRAVPSRVRNRTTPRLQRCAQTLRLI